MKTLLRSTIVLAALAVIPAFHFTRANPVAASRTESLTTFAREATSTNSTQSSAAINQLRAAGPAGLEALFAVYHDRIAQQQGDVPAKDAAWDRLRTALDTVGQQRDCYASHLYWYTDLESAKTAARASGKPILSLRLLGKLNEEYSCANSRFFRTTLYPNAEVSQYLRDHFVLHWQSVRPVPRITIDMGDGRRIERTITGNSIHYILDPNGNPIDALPGLYGAQAFIAELDRAVTAEQQAEKLNVAERETFLRNYHSTRVTEIQRQWSSDLAKIDPRLIPAAQVENASRAPDAVAAAPRAYTKSGIEIPLLRNGAETVSTFDRARLNALSTDATWQKIAALHDHEAALDPNSIKLIQFKQPPTAMQAAPITRSKALVENPMVKMIRNLQHSIAEDTVRNEYLLHSRIHEWFANGIAPAHLEALNSKIYADLFLTPNSDAWLGLAPADVFSALDNAGLVQNKTP